MRWDTSKAHNMHRARAEQKTARTAHMPVFVVLCSHWMPQPPLHGMASSSLSTCRTHNAQTTADSRLDATRIPAHGAAAEAKRTPAHDAAAVQHGGPCYAGTSATCTSGTLTTLPCSVSEWCTAWHALLCSFRTLALTTAAVRHVELLPVASCQCSQRAWVRIKLCLRHWRLSCFSST